MAANIIYYGINIIDYVIWIYSIVMVIDAILSWVPSLRDSAVGRIINRVIDPYLNIFRKGPIARLSNATGLDISFLIGLLLLYFVQDYVLNWIAFICLTSNLNKELVNFVLTLTELLALYLSVGLIIS